MNREVEQGGRHGLSGTAPSGESEEVSAHVYYHEPKQQQKVHVHNIISAANDNIIMTV